VTEIIESSLLVYNNYIRGTVSIEKNYTIEPFINCVVDEVQQVFKNIIFNSIQAMYSIEQKILRIQMESSPENKKTYVKISIEDNGIGVPPELVEKLFTPFFTTKSRGEGIGLGLFISKTIVEEHKGRILYETLESGSRFCIYLPI
jgi:signal transduction histidine kinase